MLTAASQVYVCVCCPYVRVSLCACAVVVVHVRVYVCASVSAYVFVYFTNLIILFFALCTCGLCIPPLASPILISHAGVPV